MIGIPAIEATDTSFFCSLVPLRNTSDPFSAYIDAPTIKLALKEFGSNLIISINAGFLLNIPEINGF